MLYITLFFKDREKQEKQCEVTCPGGPPGAPGKQVSVRTLVLADPKEPQANKSI